MEASVTRAAWRVLDMLLPPRCLSCGAIVGGNGLLCGSCWSGLTFIGEPRCACCGMPFPFDAGEDALCAGCLAQPPDFAVARAALLYDDASRPLVLGFKHGDRTDAAPVYARWLARVGADVVAKGDLIVPVPLHRWRLFARRYNQSAVLAQALGRMSGVAVGVDVLVRTRRTPSQGGLDRAARLANVRGAFAVRPGRKAGIEGRNVVLVDDVLTTGATAMACARALLRAGAGTVSVLTLARVKGPGA